MKVWGKINLHKEKSKEVNKKKIKTKRPIKNNVIELENASKKEAKKKDKKLKGKLSEHTAFKNKDKKKKKKRKAVWVKEFTLYYEQELHKLQIELLKMQKPGTEQRFAFADAF